jgi:predicted nucleotidyltransferase
MGANLVVPVKEMTMSQLDLLRSKRSEILGLAAKFGARNVRVFGSVARGDDRPDSDIDLLVDMEPGRSLFDLVGYWQGLEELMRCRVDVVTEKGLKPRVRGSVMKEVVAL